MMHCSLVWMSRVVVGGSASVSVLTQLIAWAGPDQRRGRGRISAVGGAGLAPWAGDTTYVVTNSMLKNCSTKERPAGSRRRWLKLVTSWLQHSSASCCIGCPLRISPNCGCATRSS